MWKSTHETQLQIQTKIWARICLVWACKLWLMSFVPPTFPRISEFIPVQVQCSGLPGSIIATFGMPVIPWKWSEYVPTSLAPTSLPGDVGTLLATLAITATRELNKHLQFGLRWSFQGPSSSGTKPRTTILQSLPTNCQWEWTILTLIN